MKVNFPFTCVCQTSGICVIDEPVQINAMYVAPDCRTCGNTIIIIPKKKLLDAVFEYTVRISKTVREEKIKTPGVS